MLRGGVRAAVEKAEEMRRQAPESFFGHRKRMGVALTSHWDVIHSRASFKSCLMEKNCSPPSFGGQAAILVRATGLEPARRGQ